MAQDSPTGHGRKVITMANENETRRGGAKRLHDEAELQMDKLRFVSAALSADDDGDMLLTDRARDGLVAVMDEALDELQRIIDGME